MKIVIEGLDIINFLWASLLNFAWFYLMKIILHFFLLPFLPIVYYVKKTGPIVAAKKYFWVICILSAFFPESFVSFTELFGVFFCGWRNFSLGMLLLRIVRLSYLGYMSNTYF